MRSKFLVYASLGLVAAASIGVAATFAYAASGQLALVKSNINIITPSQSITYNGEIQTFTGEGAYYNGELGMGDGIIFSSDKTEVFKAGKYKHKVKYEILNSNGQNAKKDYNIKEDFGIITVKKRKIEIGIKPGHETGIPEGNNPIDVSKLNISGDGIADNDYVTYYCNKISQGNTFKFTFSLESRNLEYNTSTTNCYTVNAEDQFLDESLLDYLPPGTQLPEDFGDNFDPDVLPEGGFEFPDIGDIEGGPDIGDIVSKTAIMKVDSRTRGFFLLRGTSFGDYNYKGFDKAAPYHNNYGNNPNQFFSNYLKHQEKRELKITYLNNFRSDCDFAPYFCANNEYQANDIDYIFEKDKERTYKTYSYSFIPQTNLDAIDNLVTYEDMSFYESSYRDFVHNTYLTMPDPFYTDTLTSYLAGQGVDINLGLKDFDKALMNMFNKNFDYDFKAYEGSEDTVYEFLTSAKIGNCQNFASAATLIYRAKGIPARYTTGFFLYNKYPEKGTIITPMQAHAWVEIYKDGFGWIPLDYTVGVADIENVFGEEEVDPEIEDPNDTGEKGDATLSLASDTPETKYLMDVKASKPGKYYLREESYGDFELNGFASANKYKVTDNTNPNHFTANALYSIGQDTRNIDITYKEKYGTRHELVPSYFQGSDLVSTDCDLYYDYATIENTKNLTSYDFDYIKDSSKISDYKINDPLLKEEESNYYYYARKYYRTVPEDVKAIVEKAIYEFSPVIPQSPDLICKVINDYFSKSSVVFDPNLKFNYSDLIQDLEGFFKNQRVNCNSLSIASIATMLLRSLDIPTRIVKGFLYIAEDETAYALTQYNEHYWNEIYVKGVGWVIVDFLSSSGKLKEEYFLGKTHITIKTDNYETIYDGKYQDAPEPYVLEGDDIIIENEHFLDYEYLGATDAGEYALNYSVTIKDFDYADKNYCYAIDYDFGLMTIQKTPITIYTKSISETFEAGKVLKTEIERIECPTFLMDQLTFEFEGAQLTNIGSTTAWLSSLEIVNANGVDITSNFEITTVEGVLEFK